MKRALWQKILNETLRDSALDTLQSRISKQAEQPSVECVLPGLAGDTALICRAAADHGRLLQCSVVNSPASCPSELVLERICTAYSPFSAPTNNGYIYNGMEGLYLLASITAITT